MLLRGINKGFGILELARVGHLADLEFAALIAFECLLELVVCDIVVGHNALHKVEPVPPVDACKNFECK